MKPFAIFVLVLAVFGSITLPAQTTPDKDADKKTVAARERAAKKEAKKDEQERRSRRRKKKKAG